MTEDFIKIYFTKDDTPTTRKTSRSMDYVLLGNESYARKNGGMNEAIYWAVQAPNGKLKHICTSRDVARKVRRGTYPEGRVVALG